MSRTLRPDTAVVSVQSFKRGVCCQLQAACLTLERLQNLQLREAIPPIMPEKMYAPPQQGATEIPEEIALEIRKLAHDLSNALEIIVQTSYLLGTVQLKEPGKDWLQMLDNGVHKALEINLALRTYIKSNSPR